MLRILLIPIFLLQYGNGFPQNITITRKSVTEEDKRSDFVPRVVNGQPAKLGDVPYQLSLKVKYKKMYVSYCGATLIAPSKVVSAAHCFHKRNEAGYFARCSGRRRANSRKLRRTHVVAGNLKNEAAFQDGGQWRKLKSMKIPGTFKFPQLDISVGFTTKPFVLNAHVNTIPIANQYKDYDQICRVSGYGSLAKNEIIISDILLLADLEMIPEKICSEKIRRNMKKFVCTSQQVSTTGKGDSGGPLVCAGTNDPADRGKGVLVGVVCGHNKRRGTTFLTRVSIYKNFINRGNAILTPSNNVLFLMCLLNSGMSIL